MTLIIFRIYYFRIIIKNLTKCKILKNFALKNNGKFADIDSEKFCSLGFALASTIPALGFESVCPQKVGLGRSLGFFWSPHLRLQGCVIDSTSGHHAFVLINKNN